MNHRSLAFRLAVWYALLLSATFALVGTGMFYGLEQYLRSNLSDSLRRRSAQVEQILQHAPAGDQRCADRRCDRYPRRPGIQQSLCARHPRPRDAGLSLRVARPIAASIRRHAPADRPLAARSSRAPRQHPDGPHDDQRDAGRRPPRAATWSSWALARADRGGAGSIAEPAGLAAAGAGRLRRRRRLSVGAAGAATGRANVADRRADQRAEPRCAAAGCPDRRCAGAAVDLAQSHARTAARFGADLAPLPGRRLA